MLVTFYRAIRSYLKQEENLLLLGHLPVTLKDGYAEGLNERQRHSRLFTLEGFIAEMIDSDPLNGTSDFHNVPAARSILATMIEVLNKYISRSTMNDIVTDLPYQLKEFFKNNEAVPRFTRGAVLW